MEGCVSEWVTIWIPGWYTNGYVTDKWLAFPIFLLQSNCLGDSSKAEAKRDRKVHLQTYPQSQQGQRAILNRSGSSAGEGSSLLLVRSASQE